MLGWRSTLALIGSRYARRASGSTLRKLHPRGSPPFHFRPDSSDPSVIAEVFLDQSCAPLFGQPDVSVIVDAGANIGAASVVLLEAYREATLLAIEPDPGNFAVLTENLTAYAARARACRAALWDAPARLRLDRGHFRDGREWTYQVRPAETAAPDDVEALTVGQLLADEGWPSIDILKVDVEGAERTIFQPTARAWLDRVRMIAIELHDAACEQVFADTVAPFPAEITRVGDLTIWRRRDR